MDKQQETAQQQALLLAGVHLKSLHQAAAALLLAAWQHTSSRLLPLNHNCVIITGVEAWRGALCVWCCMQTQPWPGLPACLSVGLPVCLCVCMLCLCECGCYRLACCHVSVAACFLECVDTWGVGVGEASVVKVCMCVCVGGCPCLRATPSLLLCTWRPVGRAAVALSHAVTPPAAFAVSLWQSALLAVSSLLQLVWQLVLQLVAAPLSASALSGALVRRTAKLLLSSMRCELCCAAVSPPPPTPPWFVCGVFGIAGAIQKDGFQACALLLL